MKAKGKIYLVGAGAGSFWYLTEYARFLLEHADVVVYDRLVDRRVLLLTKGEAKLIPVGKTPGTPAAQQENINRLLLSEAKEGRTVVRLKGGDPFVFGRGGEEALYLATHGIPFEVIPGISSVHVAASRALVPLTFRGMSQSFHVFSGHPKEALDSLPWELIARLPGTLVFLMSSSTLATIAARLVASGKDPKTPSCLVEWAGNPRQRVVFGNLENIAWLQEQKGLRNPLLVLIGQMVSISHALRGEDKPPSSSKRVMIVGSRDVLRKERWISEEVLSCEREGIEVIPMPILQPVSHHEVLDRFLTCLEHFTVILFASPTAVSIFFEQLFRKGKDIRTLHTARLWTIGRKTAEALAQWGLYADYVASGNAVALLQETAHFPPHRVAIITSDRGGQALKENFLLRGWFAEVFPVYSMEHATRLFPVLLEELEVGLDLLVFLSPSAYDAFVSATEGQVPQCAVWAMGQTTASYLEERGVSFERIVASPAFDDVLREVMQWHRGL
ncbi:uroporphyrinogen-III C-methyltransferase [Candidatus Caldatribacterium sp.]|uniref:uroporphyrinogen-III C-methyltransferase n=1 Tax=Candidatus Caldatribacterium sp. TaxID=2282143 RepID=UPI002993B5A3|nr:uroporphyrinogen-III C-methyltransferase [Candidatus Caldatribacterium sp.]MDW8080594.1 uroporphyrinogen-III C-methyltransferase [Candidatus Calescibacterium sp.]